MKKYIALLFVFALAFAAAGCGGGANVANNETAANYNTYYGGNDTAADDSDYYSSYDNSAAADDDAAWEEPAPQYYSENDNYTYTEQDEAIGGYVNTTQDHLSTFGIDVDTASYTRTRDYLEGGSLPPVDSVRVEEFINYFDAGYPTPEEIAFGIYADGAPSPFDSPGTYLLRFGIQGYEVPEVLRKPVSLTFVIDISGSMSDPNKLDLVKQSLYLLVDRLDRFDKVAIVAYGTSAKIVLEATSGNNGETINSAIRRLNAGGSTNAEDGLRIGYKMAYQNYQSESVNRVILLSDGVANVGQTEASELLRFIEDYASTGITLTTMGFGMGTYNDPFMEELADSGDGSYAYIDNLDEARRLFVDDLTSTLQVIARDARIQVDFNTEVVAYYRLLGYENRGIRDEDFQNNTVDAGELGAGHSVTALYAVQLAPNAVGRVATVQLRWQDPDTYQWVEINGDFNTWDLEDDFMETDPHFRLAVLAAHFAELLRQSPYNSELSYYNLLEYAYPLSRELSGDDDINEFIWMLQEASYLAGP